MTKKANTVADEAESSKTESPEDEEVQTYTIDELASMSGVPSRTIRFYQSKGVLRPPVRRGRVAHYQDEHIEQLRRISELKDKGLTIRAIKDLMQRIDRGELLYSEWLGIEEEVESPWVEDRAQVMSRKTLEQWVGDQPKGLVSALEKMGAIERRGHDWFVPSLSKLSLVLRLDKAGVDPETSGEAGDIIQRHITRAAKELVEYFVKRFGSGFGHTTSAQDLVQMLGALKSISVSAISLQFAQAVQEEMRKTIQSGRGLRVGKK